MGAFQYDNPFMAMLVRIANLILLSFFWAVCCLPVVTVIPASAALYHTTAKVVRGNGSGVARDFFRTFRQEFKSGALLSLVCAAAGGLLYLGLFWGSQLWRNSIFGVVYFAAGILLAIILVPTVLYIPPVLSRFEGGISTILRLSLFLSSQHILRTLFMLALLALIVFFVDFYPVLLLILPGVYADLVCGGMEKTLQKYADENGLYDPIPEEEPVSLEGTDGMTSMELDRYLTGTLEEGSE